MRSLIFIFILISAELKSQGVFNDGDYEKADPCGGESSSLLIHKRSVPRQYLRESDVAWEKRVWRDIDLKEKQNFPLYYPTEYLPCRMSLIQIVSKHLLSGELIAFENESFYKPLEVSSVRNKIRETEEINEITYDAEGNQNESSRTVTDSVSFLNRVTKVRVMEDWYMNKQNSNLEVRIVAMGFYEFLPDKDAYKELFWVYFPALRKQLSKYRVFNGKNNSDYSSFDDLFLRREFSSLIVKENNVYDRSVSEYCNGIDALLESDRIKYEIFKMEQDWWQY